MLIVSKSIMILLLWRCICRSMLEGTDSYVLPGPILGGGASFFLERPVDVDIFFSESLTGKSKYNKVNRKLHN